MAKDDNYAHFDDLELKAQSLYSFALSCSKQEEHKLFKEIVTQKDNVIYDIALTNQTYIASKLNMSQASLSIIAKLLKVL